MATFTRTINNGLNDGHWMNAGATDFDRVGNSVKWSFNTADSGRYRAFFRFPSITLAQGTTVLSATYEAVANVNVTGGTDAFNVRGYDADDLASPPNSSATADTLLTSLTTATESSSVAMTTNALYEIDVTDIVQEILDRGGWSSGNAMCLVFQTQSSSATSLRRNYSFDLSGSYPQLTIVYLTVENISAAVSCSASATATATVQRAAEPATHTSLMTGIDAWWPLDENGTGPAWDYFNVHNLTSYNSPTSTASGKILRARDLESSSTQFFSTPSHADFVEGDTDFTLSCWVKLESKTGSNQTLMAKWSGTFAQEYILYHDVVTDKFVFAVSYTGASGGLGVVYAVTAGNASVGVWYHVLAYHDSVNNLLGISVNGLEDTASWSDGVFSGGSPFQIGAAGNSLSPVIPLDGLIDEAGKWSRVLTSGEKDYLYNSGNGIYTPFQVTYLTATATTAGSAGLQASAAPLGWPPFVAIAFVTGSAGLQASAAAAITATASVTASATSRQNVSAAITASATIAGTANLRASAAAAVTGTATVAAVVDATVHSVSAAITATGTVAGSVQARYSIASAVSVSGSATCSGSLRGSAACSVTGTGSLAGTSNLQASASGALTATGSATCSGNLRGSAVCSVTGTGSLAGTSNLQASASGALTGTGSATGSVSLAASASSAITGIATVNAVAGQTTNHELEASIIATASVTGSANLAASASGALTGTCSATCSGNLRGSAVCSVTGTGSLVGAASLQASASGALTGTCSATCSGNLGGSAACSVTGTGSATGSVSLAASASSGITGVATVNAVAGQTTSHELEASIIATASVAGSANLAASASGALTGTGTLSGTTSLAATAAASGIAAAFLSGVTTLAATAAGAITSAGTLSGVGTLDASGVSSCTGTCSVSGDLEGFKNADAVCSATASTSGTANLGASAAAAIAAYGIASGSVNLAASASASCSGICTVSGATENAGEATASCLATGSLSGTVVLAATAAGSETGTAFVSGDAGLASFISASVSASGTTSGSVNLAASASASCSGICTVSGATENAGEATASCLATGSATGTVALAAAAVGAESGIASVSGDANLASFISASISGTASTSAAANLDAAAESSCTGTCSVSGSVESESGSSASCSATASTSGSATLAATASGSETGTASVSGDASLASFISASISGTGSTSGAANLDAAAESSCSCTASVSGSTGSDVKGEGSCSATASVSGTASLDVPGTAAVLGTAITSGSATLDCAASAAVSLEAIVSALITDFSFDSTGQPGILLSGTAESSIESLTFSWEFDWSIVSNLDMGIEFTWGTGVTPLRWYRVTGRCEFPTAEGDGVGGGRSGGCSVIPFESNDTACTGATGKVRFVQNLLASGLSDLCRRLKALNWKWPITKVERFNQPVGVRVTEKCTRLEVLEHCIVPECMTLCVDEDVSISIEATFTIVDYFYSAVGSGGITLFGSADAELPASIVGSGSISTSGSASASCSYWAWSGSGSILTDGEADVTSQSWTHEGSGSILTSGSGSASVSFASYEGSGSIETSGSSLGAMRLSYAPEGFIYIYGSGTLSTFYYLGSGEILTSGAATVRRPSYVDSGSGGIVFGGEARWVSPDNHYVGDGSAAFGGSADVSSSVSRFEATGDGSISLSGDAESRSSEDGEFWWTGSGSVTLIGDGESWISQYRYLPTGSVLLSGNGTASSDWMGIVDVPFQATVELVLEEIEFAEDDADEFSGRTTMVATSCGTCDEMPLRLYLTHALDRGSILREFLARNSLEIPRVLPMRYGTVNESWQSNLHFEGWSSDGSTRERWRIVTEWACVDDLGGSQLNGNFWKFSMLIVRKNLSSGVDFDTRVTAVFPTEFICDEGDSFSFGFDFNVRNRTVVNDLRTFVDAHLFNDNIGLFRSPDWTKRPTLRFVVSEEGVAEEVARQDIRMILPVNPLTLEI